MQKDQGFHHMLREILEEPTALRETLASIGGSCKKIASELAREKIGLVYFSGSGTSYHAALASQYLMSSSSAMPTNSIPASEFDAWVRAPPSTENILIAISQSGESVDVLSAVKTAKKRGIRSVAITNATSSPLAKASDFAVLTKAGPEKAVTATKTFVCCLAASFLLDFELIEASQSYLGTDRELSFFVRSWQILHRLCRRRSGCALIEPKSRRTLSGSIPSSSCWGEVRTTRPLSKGH